MLENEDANRRDKTLGVLFQNPDSEEEDLNWQWLDEEDLKKITTDWEAIVRVLDINFDNIGVDTPKQEIDREINAIPRYVLDDIKEKSISDFNQRLTLCHPAKQLEEVSGKLKIISQSLEHNLSKKFNEFQEKYERSALSLKSLGPYSVLERGFSLTLDANGKLITSTDKVKPGDLMTTRLKNGTIKSTAQ